MRKMQRIVYWRKRRYWFHRLSMRIFRLPLLLLLWIYFSFVASIFSQPTDLRFEHFGLEEGIPNMTIYDLETDKQGALWIGTWDGLSRYDGQTFDVFRPNPFDSTSLGFQEISDIAVAPDGKIWVGTQNGLHIYDPLKQVFKQNFSGQGPRAIYRPFVNSLYHSKGGISYVVYDQSRLVGFFDPECQGFDIIPVSGISGKILSFVEFEDNLLAATQKGLAIYLPDSNTVVPASYTNPVFQAISQTYITSLEPSLEGGLWLGTTQGVYYYSPAKNFLSFYNGNNGLKDTRVLALEEDKFGGLWVGTMNGLSYLEAGSDNFITYQHNPNNPYSLSHNVVLSLKVDAAGNLWIGTGNGGLNKVILRLGKKFKSYNHTLFGQRNREWMVFHFAEGKNNRLWLATNKGLYLLDKTSKEIRKYYSIDGPPGNRLRSNQILSVFEDSREAVYVGYNNQGLDIIQLNSDQIQAYPPDENNRISTMVRIIKESVYSDRRIIWIGGNYGWGGFDPEKKFELVKYSPDTKVNGYLWDLEPDDSCHIWVINRHISRYNICQGKIADQPWNPFGLGKKPPFHPVSFTKSNQNIWMGTYGAGVLGYNPVSGTYKNFRIEHGLPNNMVYGVLADTSLSLWMSTNYGIARLEPSTGKITSYGSEDGLQDYEFASGSYLKTQDGEFFFGGVNGFTSFYPDHIEENKDEFYPQVIIKSFKISGEIPPLDSAIYLQKEIRLPGYKNQHLEFSFVALDLSRPVKNEYSFILEGLDESWTLLSAKSRAEYTHLAPGTYTFRVRGTNSNGIVSPHEARLRIIITPLWHQTWKFRVGAPVLFVLLILTAIYFRIQKAQEEERLRLNYRIAMVKQESLAAQMDHHFTFNSLNSIQRFITENKPKEAIRFISKFGNLLRRVLEQARQNYLTIEEELETLELYLSLEKLRTKNRFSYEFIIEDNVDIYNTEIPTNLLQPYLENAIWHGLMPLEDRKGKITVTFSQEKNELTCIIEDNGIGRLKAAELRAKSKLKRTSKGMEIIEERIETLNTLDNIHIKAQVTDLGLNGGDTGTRVVVTMPLLS